MLCWYRRQPVRQQVYIQVDNKRSMQKYYGNDESCSSGGDEVTVVAEGEDEERLQKELRLFEKDKIG